MAKGLQVSGHRTLFSPLSKQECGCSNSTDMRLGESLSVCIPYSAYLGLGRTIYSAIHVHLYAYLCRMYTNYANSTYTVCLRIPYCLTTPRDPARVPLVCSVQDHTRSCICSLSLSLFSLTHTHMHTHTRTYTHIHT
jgi:hypothetical protein